MQITKDIIKDWIKYQEFYRQSEREEYEKGLREYSSTFIKLFYIKNREECKKIIEEEIGYNNIRTNVVAMYYFYEYYYIRISKDSISSYLNWKEDWGKPNIEKLKKIFVDNDCDELEIFGPTPSLGGYYQSIAKIVCSDFENFEKLEKYRNKKIMLYGPSIYNHDVSELKQIKSYKEKVTNYYLNSRKFGDHCKKIENHLLNIINKDNIEILRNWLKSIDINNPPYCLQPYQDILFTWFYKKPDYFRKFLLRIYNKFFALK